MKKTLAILLILLVIVAGCTIRTSSIQTSGGLQMDEGEISGVFTDFEDSLINETDDIELGSLI